MGQLAALGALIVALGCGQKITACPEENYNDPPGVRSCEGSFTCEYGTEFCCGQTHPHIICNCLEGQFQCYYSDACAGGGLCGGMDVLYCGDVPCQCNDGLDNDQDGSIDAADSGCPGPGDDLEQLRVPGQTACTDGTDNDGDGLIDAQDPECTSPLDLDEATFGTGSPGESTTCVSHCWFDLDLDEGCEWLLGCDPLAGPALGCEPPPDATSYCATHPSACPDVCLSVVPKGCDCLGCCDVFVDGTAHTVRLREPCSLAALRAGGTGCIPCTKTTSCEMPCGPCDDCLGRGPATGCLEPSTPCPDGQTICDPGELASCAAPLYCLTGCCMTISE